VTMSTAGIVKMGDMTADAGTENIPERSLSELLSRKNRISNVRRAGALRTDRMIPIENYRLDLHGASASEDGTMMRCSTTAKNRRICVTSAAQ
jgi:hypothetical protein